MASTNTALLKQGFVTPKYSSTSRTLTGTDSGTAWCNANAPGTITFTLPKAAGVFSTQLAAGGLQFTFLVVNAYNLVIQPAPGDTIRGLAINTPITLTSVGQIVMLTSVVAGTWEATLDFMVGPTTISNTSTSPTLTIIANNEAIRLVPVNANNGPFIAGYDQTQTARTGFLQFIPGTGGSGGGTEVTLMNDNGTAADRLSFGTADIRRLICDGTGHWTMNSAAGSGTTLSVASTVGTGVSISDTSGTCLALSISSNAQDFVTFSDGTNTDSFISMGVAQHLQISGGASHGIELDANSSQAMVVTGTPTAITKNTTGVTVAGNFGINGKNTTQDPGWGAPTGNLLTTNFPGATATLVQTSQALSRVLTIMLNYGFIAA